MSFFLLGSVILGLAAGSFLTVVVERFGSGETVIGGRSRCGHCRKKLSWYELLPVLSFMVQGGRCRLCAKPIARSHPAIEILTALLFLAVAGAVSNGVINPPPFLDPVRAMPALDFKEAALVFSYYAFFAFIAVGVSFYDAAHKRIPVLLIYILAALGLIAQVVGALIFSGLYAFLRSAAAGIGAFFFFWSLWFFSKGRAMGRGDADTALAIALYLGPAPALGAFLLAFLIGAVFGLGGLLSGRLEWKSKIGLAPFLFGGAMAAIFIPLDFLLYRWLTF